MTSQLDEEEGVPTNLNIHLSDLTTGGGRNFPKYPDKGLYADIIEGGPQNANVRPLSAAGPVIIDRPRNGNGNGDGAATCATDLFVDS